jgi:uncharacterized protein (TIGR00369 family)
MTTKRTVEKVFGLKVPFLGLLGVHVEHWEKGRSLMSLTLRDELTNSWGFAHGGVVMSLLDVALATAALTTDPDAPGAVTVNLSVNFVGAGSGTLVAEGRLVRRGRSLLFCEGEVRSASGEVVATAIGTFKMRRKDAGARDS